MCRSLGQKSQSSNKICQMISKKNKTLSYSFCLFSYIRSATNITMMLYHNVFYLSFFFLGPNAFIYRIYIIYRKHIPNYICQVRIQWCLDVLQTRERFRDVIFVDESCVEMCANGKIAFHQKSSYFEKKCNRIRKPKHTKKVI